MIQYYISIGIVLYIKKKRSSLNTLESSSAMKSPIFTLRI